NVRFIEGVNAVGVDMADPNAQDDKMAKELHLPVGKKVVLKMRSQDVLHSAYFPHFRAQMNCVPGMVTQFAMTPTVTTLEMRERQGIVDRVNSINEARNKHSRKLVEKGEPGLEPYVFDYILLCNKICGRSHYNMQAKVVVETENEFRKRLSQQPALGHHVAGEKEAAKAPPVQTQPALTPEEVEEPQIVVHTTAVVPQVVKYFVFSQ